MILGSEMRRKSSIILLGLFVCLAFELLNACSVKGPPAIGVADKTPNIQTAYPSSTNICVGGCQAHQNWIEFYLLSNGYIESSLRLKTSIWLAQILTYGISAAHCFRQDKPGYTCIRMEISHHLLWGLTTLNLTPLNQLRDAGNWWLEYNSLLHP
jgi:hypothetical protein